MSYLVLARRWRPRTFSDLVGQDVVVRTIRNALSAGKLAHAYLFCGIRGVGKTTIARLMAMAVNCQQPKEGEPCGTCTACRSIMDGASFDVQEMDAASHTGVDDIREILDGVRYPPNNLSCKVFIIDEAHMLSRSAFNALLKTLEEPPANVMFILATTEAEKLPLTVRSRCQRFDLRRLGTTEIRQYLEYVLQTENIDCEAAALTEIAQAADGSVRDALSLTERVLAYADSGLTLEDVQRALGLVGRQLSCRLSEAIFAGDGCQAVQLLRDALQGGQVPRTLLQSLAMLWHQLACLKVDGALLQEEADTAHRQWLEQQLPAMTLTWLDLRYQVLLHGLRDLHLVDETVGSEMLLLRLCALHALSEDKCESMPTPGLTQDTDKSRTDAHPASGGKAEHVKSARTQPEQQTALSESLEVATLTLPDCQMATPSFASWQEAVDAYARVRPGIAAILEHVVCHEFGERVRLVLGKAQERHLASPERQAFAEWLGREVFWECKEHTAEGETLSQQRERKARAEVEHLRQLAADDPHVQQLAGELGATLVEVLPAGVQGEQQ